MSDLTTWEIEIRQAATQANVKRAIAKGRSGSIFEGRRLERKRIVKLLELAKLKTGWDLEAEIDQLIQDLKGQTK